MMPTSGGPTIRDFSDRDLESSKRAPYGDHALDHHVNPRRRAPSRRAWPDRLQPPDPPASCRGAADAQSTLRTMDLEELVARQNAYGFAREREPCALVAVARHSLRRTRNPAPKMALHHAMRSRVWPAARAQNFCGVAVVGDFFA